MKKKKEIRTTKKKKTDQFFSLSFSLSRLYYLVCYIRVYIGTEK